MEQQKPTIVLLDDEERIVRSVKAILRQKYKVLATTNHHEALAWLKTEPVMLIISDQRMPEMDGVDVLKRARKISPGTMRILLTGYADKKAIISSVNEGEIFRYIHKPWHADELQNTVDEAVAVAQSTYALLENNAKTFSGMSQSECCGAKSCNVLVFDEEVKGVCESMTGQVGFVFHYASSLDDVHKLLSEESIHIFLTYMCLDSEDMYQMVKQLKIEKPNLITMVITHNQGSDALVDLINAGQVFRLLVRPLSQERLKSVFKAAMDRIKVNAISPKLLDRTKVISNTV